MATVASSPDTTNTTDLLQSLTLGSETRTIAVPEPAKKNGPANDVPKPFNTNASFVPNGHPSTDYYYGGYDGQGGYMNDWNIYPSYMNANGGMAQGVYGDGGSYMYPQNYGYPPYGSYPSPSSSPSIPHDEKLYGLQQYQYPSYYPSPASANGTFGANKVNSQGGKTSTAATAEHVPSSVVNKGSTTTGTNGYSSNNAGSNDSYQRAGYPYVPVSGGYQDPRVGTQPSYPSDPLFSDRQSKHGAKFGLSSSAMSAKDYSSQRNTTIPQPLPQFSNLHSSIQSSGLGLYSGYGNGMYSSNAMYGQYGNTYRARSNFGSSAYGSRTSSYDNKFKSSSYGRGFDHVKRNVDGFGELNKGPRGSNSSDDKNVKNVGPVTLLLKGQDLPIKSDNQEVNPVPNKQQYNGEDLAESYSDAKFFVIKSYSEDDIHKSMKYNVWTSTPNGNKKLDAAYQEAKEKPVDCPIFLLFSVNTSGQFVGLAEMVSPVDFDRTVEYWQQDRWTGCFSVKWHIIKDIPNNALRHITLENNENKPVTNSRDTQEVKFEKGVEILKIFKEYSSKTCILDDFGFYEGREKTILEKKAKEQSLAKEILQVTKSNDLATIGTDILPKSNDGTLVNESVIADAAGSEKLVEVIGPPTSSTQPPADSSSN
ncbi:hypothetical protein P8452_18182 [Trifolium repens]|nr:hypothetical protein P8452_18182 [Trifolium repens]